MAAIGSFPLKLRIRVEAGFGGAMTDVGYADVDVDLPVTTTPLEDGAPGVSIRLGFDHLQQRITAGIEALQAELQTTPRPEKNPETSNP